MAIYFLRESKIENGTIFVEGELLHHLKNVLRVKKGEIFKFFDSEHIYLTECAEVGKDNLIFKIIEVSKIEKPKIHFHIAQSIIDKGELENAIRFLVSAKVEKISLIQTKRSPNELKESQFNRLKDIALNTAEQSEVCFVPEIKYFRNLDEVINEVIKNTTQNAFALHFGGDYTLKDIPQLINPQKPITFFVGPEGGFTAEEVLKFKNANIRIVTLKSGVLRSQFAGVITVLTTLELIALQD